MYQNVFNQFNTEIHNWQSFCLTIFFKCHQDCYPVTPVCSLTGAFRLRFTALFPEVLKKETLPHNQVVFLDMPLNFFSPSKSFVNHGSLGGIIKHIFKISPNLSSSQFVRTINYFYYTGWHISNKYLNEFLMGVASKWVKPRLKNFLCFLSIFISKINSRTRT